MTPKEYRSLLSRLKEFNADLESVLAQVEDVYRVSMEGTPQEKISVKDGILEVTERYPAVANQALALKVQIYKHIESMAGVEESEAVELLPAWDEG